MVTLAETSEPIVIPRLPSGSVKEFIPYLANHPDTPIGTLLEPYKLFEGELRKIYAQQPTHEIAKDGTVNLVPIFAGHENKLKIRARSLLTESDEEKSKFIMPLKDKDRKPNGAPAIVESLKEFQQNFNLFSESSLVDLDWSNVVAAGSSVTTSMLPVPEKWAGSKRQMREYYHQHLAPASDVDLFLYGLNEEQALEKIKQIERSIKDSILHETTTIRTKNAITIASQYPVRHVQIVLRLYDSISQIITGFDVDCACAAYDGKQVYAAPRAIAAFMTQSNTIDLTRRSPSYENRLSKYSHRGFEVHWPLLDRTRVDPTIFERSFGRTQGLARLLILEKLPKTVDRDSYMAQRRAERGRPALPENFRNRHKMHGNIKDQEEDDIAEWVHEEEVASYHTMTVPYGERYRAGKINRLLYAKDLLLNAEWNQPDDREVYLHRHPCFFGTAEEVLQDCCGYCPIPKTDEEIRVAEEESKTYISGKLTFLMDDPGRQEIGSFNPITDDEWTTMAYVGDTARLCQAIVDGDLEHVQDWCTQEGVDVNRRDYTGRTPLHLATMVSTPEIVQCLIDNGARLIARLVDGRTALHIAAARGSVQMVKSLMQRSLANQEEEDAKDEIRRMARKADQAAKAHSAPQDSNKELDKKDDEMSDSESEASEITLSGDDDKSDAMTMGSFVKVEQDKKNTEETVLEDESTEEPDIYEIDVIAWDYGVSPLHLAILNGHLETIKVLVSEYGADVLLPVKLVHPGTSNPRGAIMTIVLALSLPNEKAKAVVKLLLELGATSAQADFNHYTVFHYIVSQNKLDILDVLLTHDRPVALSVINNIASQMWGNEGDSPLTTAIEKKYPDMVAKLLSLGAKPEIGFDEWVKAYLEKNQWARSNTPERNLEMYRTSVYQPIISAASKEMGKSVEDLVAYGADPKTLERATWSVVQDHYNYPYQIRETLLDVIQKKIKSFREWEVPAASQAPEPETLQDESTYTSHVKEGTYEYWSAVSNFQAKKRAIESQLKNRGNSRPSEVTNEVGLSEKRAAIAKAIEELEHTEKFLIEAGAKPFTEMYPDIPKRLEHQKHQYEALPPEPYKTIFTFRVPDLNDAKREGYTRLFEAVWENDLETIKTLTLTPWKSDSSTVEMVPLMIAVQDGSGFNPFAIAVLRGHFDLAKKIVEICATQYRTDDGSSPKRRWNMVPHDSDDEDGDSDGEDLPIFSELVSDKFTVDNLGQVSNIVKSNVLPLTMIEWRCPSQRISNIGDNLDGHQSLFEHAVQTYDLKLFKFLINLGAEQKALLAEGDDDQKCYSIDRKSFYLAIKLGRTALLAEMIKSTGAGIPLNDLVQKSGIEIKTRPRYYQGLSVGGKKRADWAQAPGGENVRVVEERIPPLLQAAHAGSLDSVEWFMSDAPMRRYKEFAEANKHDKRIKTLEESGKGFDKTIGAWLDEKSELVLHCAILQNPTDEAEYPNQLALIKHLLSVEPALLEQRSSENWTPLQVAIWTQRTDIISLLLSHGANQRNRDKVGRNMVHSMLYRQRTGKAVTDAKMFQSIIELFDKQAVSEMLLERCNMTPGALTPLALWMAKNGSSYKKADVVAILTGYGIGEELDMINGEGDLPLHVAIKSSLPALVAHLLSLRPHLLHRENVTGRTPLEMSRDTFMTSCVSNPPSLTSSSGRHTYFPGKYDPNSVINRPASLFVHGEESTEEERRKRVWEICSEEDERLEQGQRKRRLVSLFEANEVAKRVGGIAKGWTGGNQVFLNGALVDPSEVEGKKDVVFEWMPVFN